MEANKVSQIERDGRVRNDYIGAHEDVDCDEKEFGNSDEFEEFD